MAKQSKNESGEMRQSSIVLIAFGILGIIFLILSLLRVLTILPTLQSEPLVYITLLILCVIFIITGFMSLKSAAKLKEKEDDYNSKHDEVIDWFIKGGANADKLDSLLKLNEVEEEEKFFIRTALIQEIINEQFKINDIRFLQNVSEELYNQLYEDK